MYVIQTWSLSGSSQEERGWWASCPLGGAPVAGCVRRLVSEWRIAEISAHTASAPYLPVISTCWDIWYAARPNRWHDIIQYLCRCWLCTMWVEGMMGGTIFACGIFACSLRDMQVGLISGRFKSHSLRNYILWISVLQDSYRLVCMI